MTDHIDALHRLAEAAMAAIEHMPDGSRHQSTIRLEFDEGQFMQFTDLFREGFVHLRNHITQEFQTMSGQTSQQIANVRDLVLKVKADQEKYRTDVLAKLEAISAGGNLNTVDQSNLDDAIAGLTALDASITAADTALNQGSTVGGGAGGGTTATPVFNPADTTPNGQAMADGTIRNTPGADNNNPMTGFDPNKPITA